MQKNQKIILFGGTFDPPHNGHISLLAGAAALVRPTRVIVMPTGTPPHKQSGQTAAALRMEMCKCFCGLAPQVEISDMEIRRTGKSFTIDTVCALQEASPDARIYLPMGSDMLLYFRNWKDWRALARLATLVVACREVEDAAPLQVYLQGLVAEGVRVEETENCLLPLSSTEIREKAARGEDITPLVPPLVAEIIKREGLYQAEAWENCL